MVFFFLLFFQVRFKLVELSSCAADTLVSRKRSLVYSGQRKHLTSKESAHDQTNKQSSKAGQQVRYQLVRGGIAFLCMYLVMRVCIKVLIVSSHVTMHVMLCSLFSQFSCTQSYLTACQTLRPAVSKKGWFSIGSVL